MRYAIASINQMDRATFVETLGPVFEHTPDIAAIAWSRRPFADVAALHRVMVDVMHALPMAQQLELICAHPDLGSTAKMAIASVKEQTAAGINQMTPEELETLQRLNQAYRDRFNFPFILAVKHQTKDSILMALRQRLNGSPAAEQATALDQIAEIARLRLEALIGEP